MSAVEVTSWCVAIGVWVFLSWYQDTKGGL